MATELETGHPERTALIVEDDRLVAHLLRLVLQKEGYAVDCACDGRAALQFIQQGPVADLVTLDSMLPDTTGPELVAAIRTSAEWKHVPILMLTAHSRENYDVSNALECGAAEYMEKPFTIEKLRACIGRLMSASADTQPMSRRTDEPAAPVPRRRH